MLNPPASSNGLASRRPSRSGRAYTSRRIGERAQAALDVRGVARLNVPQSLSLRRQQELDEPVRDDLALAAHAVEDRDRVRRDGRRGARRDVAASGRAPISCWYTRP